jgi:hypothetical protein
MRRTVRLIAIAAALLGALTSNAAAVTWHTSGDTAFSASATGTATFTHAAWAGSSTARCPTSHLNGTVGSPSSFTGPTWTASGTATFSFCADTDTPFIHCSWTLTATSQTALAIRGPMHLDCVVTLGAVYPLCVLHGTTQAQYANPSGGTSGRLLIERGTLTATNNGGICPYGSPSPYVIDPVTYAVTNGTGGSAPHTGPVVVRTA